jgi:hypothetical protein
MPELLIDFITSLDGYAASPGCGSGHFGMRSTRCLGQTRIRSAGAPHLSTRAPGRSGTCSGRGTE